LKAAQETDVAFCGTVPVRAKPAIQFGDSAFVAGSGW
jgi:hypothetical protein